MHYIVHTVHARGTHLLTPVVTGNALRAAMTVLVAVEHAGPVVAITVDPGREEPATLPPRASRRVPDHSSCIVSFRSGRVVSFTLAVPPGLAVYHLANVILGNAWDDEGPVVSVSALPLTVEQFKTRPRAESYAFAA